MLRRPLLILIGVFLCLPMGSANSSTLSPQEEQCYAVAMVAYDTVINAGLGLPLDEIIDSMVENGKKSDAIDIYQDYLMLVVMDAYNWTGTPHTYAVKTLYQCATDQETIAFNS